MSALYLNKRMLTQAIYMHTLVSPITLGFAFGDPFPWRKVPIQIFALDGTNLGQVNKKRLRPSLTLASVLEETILRPRQAQMLA